MNKLRYIVVVIFSLFALNMSFAQEEQGEDVNQCADDSDTEYREQPLGKERVGAVIVIGNAKPLTAVTQLHKAQKNPERHQPHRASAQITDP